MSDFNTLRNPHFSGSRTLRLVHIPHYIPSFWTTKPFFEEPFRYILIIIPATIPDLRFSQLLRSRSRLFISTFVSTLHQRGDEHLFYLLHKNTTIARVTAAFSLGFRRDWFVLGSLCACFFKSIFRRSLNIEFWVLGIGHRGVLPAFGFLALEDARFGCMAEG